MSQDNTTPKWTAQQLALIETLAIPGARPPMEEVAKKIGVSRATLYRWMDEPGFNDAVYDRAMTLIGRELPASLHALVTRAKRGDVNAIKLMLEHLGKYTPRQELQGAGGALKIIIGDGKDE